MDDSVEELLWETRRLFRALATAADEALAPLGIQESERALLEFLARADAPVSLSALARQYAVSRQHIHQTLNRLRDPEWVERLPDPDDARSVRLRLSQKGRTFWREVRAADRLLLRRIARHIDPAAARRATRTLQGIRAGLRGGTT